MSDNHDFVTIDKDRMTKCLWCETLESQKWIQAGTKTRPTGYYCSKACALAGGVEYRQRWARRLPPCGIFWIFFGVAILSFLDIELFLYAITLGITLLCTSANCAMASKKGLEIRKRVPKGSRADDRPLDLVVLERATISAACPKCGANLNLAEVESDRIFRCRYCGAEGIIEWPLDDETEK